MNYPYQHYNPKVCKKHNQPIVLFDQQKNQSLCLICVQEKTGMASFDQIQQQQEKIKTHGNEEFQKEKKQLQQLLETITQYKQNLIIGIDKIIQIIMDQIEYISSSQKKFEQQLELGNQQNTLDYHKNQLKNQQDKHNKIIIQIKQLLQDFQQKYINISHQVLILSEPAEIIVKEVDSVVKTDQIKVCEIKQEKIQLQNLEKFEYGLIEESGVKQEECCFALAFNRDNTCLFIGCSSQIKIYQFINGQIGKELQVLQNHKEFVISLYSMKQSDLFVSGSWDQSIIIWKKASNKLWIPQQKLADHEGWVNCLQMNKNEDLLISGSNDETVKFWKKENDQWNCYQTIETDKYNYVYALSLNEQENKLITCGSGAYIYVMGMQSDQQWQIKQKIKVNECGFRLCFTFKEQFLFQPKTKDYLEVYDFDSNSNQIIKLSQLQIKSCGRCRISFPCQFIKSLNILFVKHGEFLNIFRIKENCNYELMQSIKYEDHQLFGTVSDDGYYLSTWDEGSKEIQVRKLNLMNE